MTTKPPRRDAVLDLLAQHKRAIHTSEIASRLGVDERGYPALRKLLEELALEGSISALTGQRFRLSGRQVEQRGAEYQGTLTVNPRGFGFVTAAGVPDDVYVSPEGMRGAMHGDSVMVRVITRSRRGVEGEVVRVVTRRRVRVAGTLRRRGKSAWLEPDDTRVRGPVVLHPKEGAALQGEDGDAAVATITRFPEMPEENPEGELEAVLGTPGDPNVEVAKILVRDAIEESHPLEAVAEAEAYGREVSPEALAGREDLTGIPLPTIDPEDAVWGVRTPDGGYRVWIAIADVSHYVRPGTAIDQSALARGNSIYLPDRAIPMLPRALSSNLCSLLPGVVRLCQCVVVDLDATGEVRGSRVVEGYMRSAAKLTYQSVARALGLSALPERDPNAEAMREDLVVLRDVSRLLRAKRLKRGALDFDLPEPKIVLDPKTGAPVNVEKRTQDPGVKKAYQLIEELMLLANETIARWLVDRGVPTIFRVHAKPDEGKLERFVNLCHEIGIEFDVEDAADPKKLSQFLKKVAAHPKHEVLNMLLLRSMKQAVYDVHNVGHFGLASDAYLHFTSPIRRYPDLVVHRSVRSVIRGEPIEKGEEAVEKLRLAATTASETERRGMEVEREVVDLYRALLMRSHLGETFEGTVTALVSSGVFVALDSPFVDVLVRMDALGPDSYEQDEEGLRLVGVRSGDRIALGDRMLVQIEDVAILRRTVYARRLTGKDQADQPRHRREVVRSKKTRVAGPRAGTRPIGRKSAERPKKKGRHKGR